MEEGNPLTAIYVLSVILLIFSTLFYYKNVSKNIRQPETILCDIMHYFVSLIRCLLFQSRFIGNCIYGKVFHTCTVVLIRYVVTVLSLYPNSVALNKLKHVKGQAKP